MHLALAFVGMPQLKQLNISDNPWTTDGLETLCRALSRCRRLEELEVGMMAENDAQGICQWSSTLVEAVADLCDGGLNSDDEPCSASSDAGLRELKIVDANLRAHDWKRIFARVARTIALRRLSLLRCGQNGELCGDTSRSLSDGSVAAALMPLSAALSALQCPVETLSFAACDHIDDDAGSALAEALRSCPAVLSTEASHPRLRRLAPDQPGEGLRELIITKCRIGPMTINAIADALQSNRALQRLTLSAPSPPPRTYQSTTTPNPLGKLFRSVGRHSRIEELNVSGIPIADDDVLALINAMQERGNTHLYLVRHAAIASDQLQNQLDDILARNTKHCDRRRRHRDTKMVHMSLDQVLDFAAPCRDNGSMTPPDQAHGDPHSNPPVSLSQVEMLITDE
jgi:hypothetical protein